LNGINVSKVLSFPVFNDFKVAIVVIMPDNGNTPTKLKNNNEKTCVAFERASVYVTEGWKNRWIPRVDKEICKSEQ